MDIQGKSAIVTGGGAGFGLRLVERLVEGGCRVAVFDIDRDRLSALESRLAGVMGVECDVSSFEQVEQSVAQVFEAFGQVDILVNNAGIMKSAPLVNLLGREDRRHPLELWQRVMDVNLNAVFYMTVNVADRMVRLRTPGVIVNVSSISARGNAGQSAYAASKAGCEALTRVWAKELGRLGIRCAAVAPGFADTQGAHDALEKELLSRWVQQVPLRRLGTVEEVVDSILYIIRNDFFNGQVLGIDGGLVI